MRIPDYVIEEILARIPVSEVVGRRVRLKRAGRELVGLSPFAAEKSPSFYVNDEKRFYHDFSTGKHGTIFNFLMEMDGISFREAAEALAQEAGVEIPGADRREVTEEERARRAAHADEMERRRREDQQQRMAADEKLRARKRASAGQIWREGWPIGGTRAAAYLEGRGIDPRFFIADAALRFHPALWHDFAEAEFPALLGLATSAEGKPIGVWRIYLGDGRKGRAPVDQQKLGKGDFQGHGAAVRLGGMGETIGLGEGIETSKAAEELQALGGWELPVWAGLSAGGIAGFIAPAGVRRIIVFGDEDLAKRDKITGAWRTPAGLSAVQELQRRYAGTDVEVVDETPMTNSGKVDYVDLLRKWKGLPDEL